jgi:aspartyl-tRNA(Asn)/glutamyl-tRNA(Gln) amidotransferase subunit A
MGFGGLGSDTGGSCRIPAALCGVVGYKPTAARVPLAGALPLSFSLDSIGPIARSVACCRALDGVIADAPVIHAPLGLAGLRLAVLRNYVEEGMEDAIARPYAAALSRLSAAGAQLTDLLLPEIEELPAINATGGFAASEAWAWHRSLIERAQDSYDPRILARIRRGERMSAENYITLMQARRAMIGRVAARLSGYDAVLMPTVPLAPPAIAAVTEERDYNRVNMLLLRNTSIANFLDGCSISLPCQAPGEAPAGLMLMAMGGADARLFAVAEAVEGTVSPAYPA